MRDCGRCKELLGIYYEAAERHSQHTVRLTEQGNATPDEFQALCEAVTTARNACLAARSALVEHQQSLACDIRRMREYWQGEYS